MTGNFRATLISSVLLVLGMAAIGEASAGTESFRQTCDNVRIVATAQGQEITAVCRTKERGGFKSFIPANLVVPPEGCRDIANIDGNLVCYRNRPASQPFPGGTWTASCTGGGFLQGSIFLAQCKNITGTSNTSQIDVASCPRWNLTNINGRLRCG